MKYYEIMAQGDAVNNQAVGADFYYPDDEAQKDQLEKDLEAQGLYTETREILKGDWEYQRDMIRRKNLRLMGMR